MDLGFVFRVQKIVLEHGDSYSHSSICWKTAHIDNDNDGADRHDTPLYRAWLRKQE